MFTCKKHKHSNRRKSFKGGQCRWPAPFNPAPPHPLPLVKNRFQNFRPLILSQFGGKKRRTNIKRRTNKNRRSNKNNKKN